MVFDSNMISISKRIYVYLVHLFWLLVSFVKKSSQSIFPILSFNKYTKSRGETNSSIRAKGSKDEIESETSNQLLKGFWLQLINISSCIYKKNHLLSVLKGFASQIIGNSSRIYKYLIPLLIGFLILYGTSKQGARKSPVEPEVDVPPIIIEDIQHPVPDLMTYYSNSHVEILSDHLNKALDSVRILHEMSNYVKQHNAENIPLCVKNWEVNDKPAKGESSEKHKDCNNRKYLVCFLLLLESLVGMCLIKFSPRIRAIFCNSVPTREIDPFLKAKIVADISNHIQKTFISVQIIRDILSDYVKQHTEFEEE
ncbi:hypothetical protein RND81_13G135200 [Saponaria officinalis]|uniref:Uncharacterized protein n=1 Tax=Saponaria officinalis TaxID=3572 RepID=A0AAW1H654_SAPOF